MPEFIDVRDFVLSGKVKPKQQAIYIEELGGWFTLQGMMGDGAGDVLNNSIDQKTGRANIKLMYAELFVRSLRYPVTDGQPIQPIEPTPLEENATYQEQNAYDKALVTYQRNLKALTHPYPDNHPNAGELVFNALDRDAANKTTPGEILELVAEIALSLNGMSKADLDEKKVNSNSTIIDSTLSPSQSNSDTSIPT